jgi:hypothetical protein
VKIQIVLQKLNVVNALEPEVPNQLFHSSRKPKPIKDVAVVIKKELMELQLKNHKLLMLTQE